MQSLVCHVSDVHGLSQVQDATRKFCEQNFPLGWGIANNLLWQRNQSME